MQKPRKALQDVRYQHLPVFREIVEFLTIETLSVCRHLDVVQHQIPSHHPPRATAHAQCHAHCHVDKYFCKVVWKGDVQLIEPTATWKLVIS